ncbi:MAG TPA: rhodanese-like domain-containing protein [Burkholderiales bacterium]|nr:rhodanese-like domain-containing protein [Burkholderiales bacterium]
MHLRAVALLGLLYTLAALPGEARQPGFADEDRDWGVAPVRSLRLSDYHAPTPLEVPKARTIRTVELKALLERDPRVVLVDVLGSPPHPTLPGAVWMPNAGLGDFFGGETQKLEAALDKLSGGDRERPLVFFCLSAECWLSYNASLRALAFGYRNVIWYRGGVEAWKAANYPMSLSAPYPWN